MPKIENVRIECIPIGKTFKNSKKLYSWRFDLEGNPCTIELFVSKYSGKKKLFANGVEVGKDQCLVGNFEFVFYFDKDKVVVKSDPKREITVFVEESCLELLYDKERNARFQSIKSSLDDYHTTQRQIKNDLHTPQYHTKPIGNQELFDQIDLESFNFVEANNDRSSSATYQFNYERSVTNDNHVRNSLFKSNCNNNVQNARFSTPVIEPSYAKSKEDIINSLKHLRLSGFSIGDDDNDKHSKFLPKNNNNNNFDHWNKVEMTPFDD